MIGVAAVALDQGYRIVVVLAGLKDDLRRQTARRFNTQLLLQSDPIPGTDRFRTLDAPEGPGPLGGFGLPFYYDANYVPALQIHVERVLARNEPCIIVVKKNVTSLQALANALRVVYRRFGIDGTQTLILDDECDEASVPGPGDDRLVPAGIASIWERSVPAPRVAYVGYTATAAASLLQDPSNALFPKHFARLLKYPGNREGLLSYEYPEPDGWYTGGEAFYKTFGDEPGEESNFLVSPTVDHQQLHGDPRLNDSLYEAVIAYFIAGAFRLALQVGPEIEAGGTLPFPHSMMVQTSTSRDDHRAWREAIRDIFLGEDFEPGLARFYSAQLMPRVSQEESRWRAWYERLDRSRSRLYERRPHRVPYSIVAWDQILALLPAVFDNTVLKAVNSDEDGQTLDYEAGITRDGAPSAPQDIFVIVVGGSKLSRGLTVEGLCISYYTRSSARPHEDTTLQTSRWFGYRGPYFEFCRLFTTQDTYERLLDIHENDIDHRGRLAQLMENGESVDRARLALRTSPTCLLTGKIGVGQTVDLAFSPFNHVFSYVETRDFAEVNQQFAAALLDSVRDHSSRDVRSHLGTIRGLLSTDWGATEIADLLDGISYSSHNPDASAYPMPALYRPLDSTRRVQRRLSTAEDPYVVAAYLRYWAERQGIDAPRFNVGVTFGSMPDSTAPFDFPLLNRKIEATGFLEGGWSGASGDWKGDQFFDDPPPHLLDPLGLRVVGANGLLLLHLVHRDAQGRAGLGIRRNFHTPTFGIAVPAGGPPFSVVINYRL